MGDCIDHGQAGDKHGYGRATRGGKRTFLHRFVYCEKIGAHIDDIAHLVVRHTCDNTRCVNPDHLLIGTQADNMRDMSIRRRHPKMKLTVEQVAFIRANCNPHERKGKRKKEHTYKSMADKFGVAPNAVRQAYFCHSYKHLPPAPVPTKEGQPA